LIGLMDVVWITQWEADREALAQAEAALRAGYPLAMAPEGTRSKTGALMKARAGVAFLATRLDVPVVPVAMQGTERLKQNVLRLRRTDLSLTIGRPFRLAPVAGRGRSRQLDERTDVIMAHIAHLLPERYWGEYAQHPYVQQLARGEGPLPGELPAD
jgi:1-acyl-sn-glycerol-3-phosphate acyltransferase